MIEIEKVNKYFNKHKKNEIHVIDNTNLTIEDTGLVSILGQSGCGKTTLLNSIGGLDSINKGKILVNGKKITSKFSYKADKIRNLNIGYIFQDYKLIDDMSVFDNVAISLKLIGIKNKKLIKEKVNYVLEKVGIYRYRNRPASMLSGGERQRVGIARAIVKNPKIIIADEPTGNLDSKNSLEIMNIIKAISNNHLVLLVTHENNLAKFYSDRIIELVDGKVVNDYLNKHENDLEYRIDNRIYLKDIENNKKINTDDYNINLYSESDKKIKLDIVIKNNNIYIKSNTNDKIEIVDEDSSVEFIDDNYKSINKKDISKYNFDETKLKNKKIKYCSIFNPISFIKNGFIKVFDYTFLKKILLVGFFLSGIFITYALSTLFASIDIRDSDFVRINKNYLTISEKKNKVDDYIEFKNNENINYIIPGDTRVNFSLNYNMYYQTSFVTDTLTGSLTSNDLINNKDLLYGTMPKNDNEIVIDKIVIKNMFLNNYAKMVGINDIKDMLNMSVTIPNMDDFKIVGIVDLKSPSIYVNNNKMFDIIYNSPDENSESNELVLNDYDLFKDNITLKSGRIPSDDYETIVNISNKDNMPLNKTINNKINNKKLKVVGYYDSSKDINYFLVNNNSILYDLINKKSDLNIIAVNKDNVLNDIRKDNFNINDSYVKSKEDYKNRKKKDIKNSIIVSSIIIGISLIEILLMMRSSFLSRVREVGIYRAIGVKMKDIYIMFLGEILAITVLTSIPGILIASYVLKQLSNIAILSRMFMMNIKIVLLACVSILLFNIIVGLIPVFNTILHKPAKILSRNDVD